MKERPILFSGEMVRAILEGRKIQTRRILQVQPPSSEYRITTLADSTARKDRKHIGAHHWAIVRDLSIVQDHGKYFRCPYGRIGDRLWVRETWGDVTLAFQSHENEEPEVIAFRADEGVYNAHSMKRLEKMSDSGIVAAKWKPSIFLPRRFSRLALEITGVRVERLQDISEADAVAEGIELVSGDYNRHDFTGCWRDYTSKQHYWNSPIDSFHSAWDSINGKLASWKSSPWVWVVEFRRNETTETV